MPNPDYSIAQLLQEDRRYALEAYIFVSEALQYAQNVLHMGVETASLPSDDPPEESHEMPQRQPGEAEDPSECDDDFVIKSMEERERQQHVSGQQLCEAIRRYALEQYGYMAKTVLNRWGVHETSDFGEIVFNLIRIGQMRKTPSDAQVDFDNIYDFETAFKAGFKITPPHA